MSLESKTIKINDDKVVIKHFEAIEVLRLRMELINFLKQNVSESMDVKDIISIIFIIESDMYFKMFKNCEVEGIGSLGEEANFNQFFKGRIDSCSELLLEVINFNGFFTKGLIINMINRVKNIPLLQEFAIKLEEMLELKS